MAEEIIKASQIEVEVKKGDKADNVLALTWWVLEAFNARRDSKRYILRQNPTARDNFSSRNFLVCFFFSLILQFALTAFPLGMNSISIHSRA